MSILQAAGEPIVLDHLGIRDIPGETTGLDSLRQAFLAIGFVAGGQDYVNDKLARFSWLREEDFESLEPRQALPQIVVAESDVARFPAPLRSLVDPLIRSMSPCRAAIADLERLARLARRGDLEAERQAVEWFRIFFSSVRYGQPNASVFQQIAEQNELVAWTLLFGRQVNHFGFGVYLSDRFRSLSEFNRFLAQEGLTLHRGGGEIKGSAAIGIEQSATISELKEFRLVDGTAAVRNRFLEYIWRHEIVPTEGTLRWSNLFRDFIPENANTVLESLYANGQ